MLEHLPAPGDYWPKEERKRWLQILELVFDIVYDDTPPAADDMVPHGG